MARGKLMLAAQQGQPIPLGWALDAQVQPTTDPQAGMDGRVLPIGAASSAKGAMLVSPCPRRRGKAWPKSGLAGQTAPGERRCAQTGQSALRVMPIWVHSIVRASSI